MAISDDDIERIRSTVSIVDVVGQHVQLKRVGRNWVGLCPFHAEKTPSFNVREETGRYRCFGCGQAGDVFSFVQEIEHVDFVAAVEQLASRAGMTLTYTSTGQSKERARRKKLVGAMGDAIEWYHQRLLTAPDAGTARGYLRSRGIGGEWVRKFQVGWAPDEWDALSAQSGIDDRLLQENGLAFRNRAHRLQDSFRGRVLFPIFSENGEPVAIGGRILPGSADPAKYKNSSETPIYTKSKTLYALNWAKGDIVNSGQAIVCEGYTDVIGFFRAGLPRAVATCGTAFTEEHIRLLKRYASKIVLAFDADAAGQGAAERFYEWEDQYQVEVTVATLPGGKDPGELAESDPSALATAIDDAQPFLRFRTSRVLGTGRPSSHEERVRLGTAAMAVINEHPNMNVRKLYAGEVATRLDLPTADLVQAAERRTRQPIRVQPKRAVRRDNAEFVALAVLAQSWDEIADWLVPELFDDDVHHRAFLAMADTNGDLNAAIAAADPEARDVLERAAVVDIEVEPEVEARNLVCTAVRRELTRTGGDVVQMDQLREDREARLKLEAVSTGIEGFDETGWLLGWLKRRKEHRGG